jgi:hypothetical protein
MASTPDPAPSLPANPGQARTDTAAQLNAELAQLQAKFARLMQEAQELLRRLEGAPPSNPDSVSEPAS